MEFKNEPILEPRAVEQNRLPKNKKLCVIIVIVAVVIVVVVAVVLGVVLGTKKDKTDKKDEKEDDLIVNSYDNTEELIKKFPVLNPTTVKSDLEAKRLKFKIVF